MNNKGFTLVELLAVMVILLSISVVTVTNVTASLKKNEKKEKENQEKIAINAAKIYFSIKGGNYVTINTLITGEDGDGNSDNNVIIIEDSNSVSKLNKSYYVVICSNKNEYKIKSDKSSTC